MIVISQDLVVTDPVLYDPRNPRIGWHNLATSSNMTADEQADGFAVANIANPATYLAWRGTTTSVQYVKMSLGAAADVNYFAIAKHNLGSTGATVRLQYSTNNTDWSNATDIQSPSDDGSLIVEFDTTFARWWRLQITPDTTAPQIAVLHIGEIMPVQRRIYVGHTPFTYARKDTISTGRSEDGHFLGRVLRNAYLEGDVEFKNLTPSWYRQTFEPFVQHARTKPFFWAWRPSAYPNEVGYAWSMGDIQPSNQLPNGMMQVSMRLQGVR